MRRAALSENWCTRPPPITRLWNASARSSFETLRWMCPMRVAGAIPSYGFTSERCFPSASRCRAAWRTCQAPPRGMALPPASDQRRPPDRCLRGLPDAAPRPRRDRRCPATKRRAREGGAGHAPDPISSGAGWPDGRAPRWPLPARAARPPVSSRGWSCLRPQRGALWLPQPS